MEKDHNDKNIGKKLDGRYEITESIGEGGMADVYRATDVVDNKTVAVKILKKEFAENEEFLRRFRNESKAIAVLSHPNIVKIFDVGFSERIQFIVMEYIDGITLNEFMEQQGRLDWKDAVHFILQILRALQHAHSKGIVHRDIKPQNIMVLRDGTIKVMDFGIAKFAREDGKTGSDKAIGTVHYISPEQARGAATDAKSDIYSVGVMLYEMLTGKKPFDTDNPVSIAVMHMQAKVPLPSSVNPDIQIGLEEIILKAMEKDPADRYQTARDMMDDLQTFKENPDGVFGYYPELLGEDPFGAPENDDATRAYEPADGDEFDEFDDTKPYDGEEEYYDEDDVYEDEYTENGGGARYAVAEGDEEEYEEEERGSYFVPILSAVIIVIIVVAGVLFTTLIYNMFKGNNGLNTSDEMRMPSLVGMDFTEAQLTYGDQIRIEMDSREYSTLERDKIFDQDIAVNDPVSKGDTVKVKVSLGTKKVQIQDYSGWDFVTADAAIRNLNCYVDKRNMYDDNVEAGLIISTEPKGPCEVEPGAYIRVNVSLGKMKTTVQVPNFIDSTWDDAKTLADTMGLVLSKNEVDDKAPAGTILNQNVAVGEEVSEDSVIELTVSTGTPKDQEVRVSFSIPTNAAGMFRIKLYEDGIAKSVGPDFNVDYANGITSVTISGTGTADVLATLTNAATGAEATIGTYRVDFDNQTYNPISSNPEAAFEKVGGLVAVTQTSATTTQAQTTATTTQAQTTASTTQATWQNTEATTAAGETEG